MSKRKELLDMFHESGRKAAESGLACVAPSSLRQLERAAWENGYREFRGNFSVASSRNELKQVPGERSNK